MTLQHYIALTMTILALISVWGTIAVSRKADKALLEIQEVKMEEAFDLLSDLRLLAPFVHVATEEDEHHVLELDQRIQAWIDVYHSTHKNHWNDL